MRCSIPAVLPPGLAVDAGQQLGPQPAAGGGPPVREVVAIGGGDVEHVSLGADRARRRDRDALWRMTIVP